MGGERKREGGGTKIMVLELCYHSWLSSPNALHIIPGKSKATPPPPLQEGCPTTTAVKTPNRFLITNCKVPTELQQKQRFCFGAKHVV